MSANENQDSYYFYCHMCESRQENVDMNVNCPTCGSGFIERFPNRVYNIRPIEASRLMLPIQMNRPDPNPIEGLEREAQRRNIEELFPHFLRFREMLLNHGRRILANDFDNLGRPVFERIRPIEGSLTEDEMKKLTSVVLTQNDLDKIPTCPICLNEYEVNERVTELNCHHRYHAGCINVWLKDRNSCPSCRTTVTVQAEPQPSTSSGESRNYFHDLRQLRLFQLIRQRRQQLIESNAMLPTIQSRSNPPFERPIIRPIVVPPPTVEVIDITSSSDEEEEENAVPNPINDANDDGLLSDNDSTASGSVSNNSENMDDCVYLSSTEGESSDDDCIIID